MSRYLQRIVAGLVACSVLAAPLRAEDGEWTIIASAQDSPRATNIGPVQLNEFGGVVIRSAADLVTHSGKPDAVKDTAVRKALETELAELLKVDAIDWSKQMVLAVRGEPGTKADRIHFESLRVEGKVLTIAWKVKQRPPHAGPGTPIALILVERFDGEVKFAH
jgi:hypothetical protein